MFTGGRCPLTSARSLLDFLRANVELRSTEPSRSGWANPRRDREAPGPRLRAPAPAAAASARPAGACCLGRPVSSQRSGRDPLPGRLTAQLDWPVSSARKAAGSLGLVLAEPHLCPRGNRCRPSPTPRWTALPCGGRDGQEKRPGRLRVRSRWSESPRRARTDGPGRRPGGRTDHDRRADPPYFERHLPIVMVERTRRDGETESSCSEGRGGPPRTNAGGDVQATASSTSLGERCSAAPLSVWKAAA